MVAQKRMGLALVLLSGIILLSGCETSKGAACGTANTACAFAKGVGDTACGAGKDSVSLWQEILKADDWIKRNMW